MKVSMRDRLLKAESFDALELLRKEQRKYNNATANTKGKWRKAFAHRWSQLEAELTADQLETERKRRKEAKASREQQS